MNDAHLHNSVLPSFRSSSIPSLRSSRVPQVSGALPSFQRTNTSFFKNLVASDLFSPGSREMFQAWADSPRDTAQGVPHVASDAAAPLSLRHVASQEGLIDPPKMTRSISSCEHRAYAAMNVSQMPHIHMTRSIG